METQALYESSSAVANASIGEDPKLVAPESRGHCYKTMAEMYSIAPPPDVVPPPPTPSAPRRPRAPRRPPASSRPSTSSTKEYSVQLSSTSVRNSKQDSGFVNDIFMSEASDDEFLSQL